MQSLTALVSACSNFIWGVPMLVMLFGTHLFLTVRLRLVQRHIPKAIRLSLSPDEGSQGEISQFGALATALAATIGTGNIIGVSTAIALGGPGAVLWCWLTGVFGIATKYGEALLAVKYRTRGKSGAIVGGPMYTIERGLGWKWLAVIFAAFTVLATFGAGCTVQSHAITDVIHTTFGVAPAISGLVVTAVTAVVILGGVKAIAKVCEKLVPFMSLFYILGCIAILVLNAPYLGQALALIVKSAFGFRQVAGGFAGGAMMAACRYGMARGLFSNESGLGTAPIAAATAQTKNPVRQALVSMTGTFWDTVIVCAMTGIVVVSSMVKQPELYQGASDDAMTRLAFANLPAGQIVLALALSVFAFTTILGWSYYGERCVEYLFGPKGIPVYRLVFLVVLFIGAVANLDLVWSFADLMNGLMAFPNLISVLLLSGVIVAETRHYLWENRLDEQAETLD
ncbi:alanine/glycine:cation symporter family protein [Allofournierella massiliensis]|uniref:AGCS family alanine or glycine:cation symporter n=2 Tax=Allofournierella massiliensis TaxID=1650663 RepID=A0A4R1QER2_9FIRM|nr:sodium:alanine symporter family protein [Fournierella massiliensis]TCL48367.1 AGCS family alanine or glycine:cation symporter [Fournierella massiliensis]